MRRPVRRPLAPAQINKTLKRLSQILELAEEYGYIERNQARGRRRRAKAGKPRRSWVEPEQVPSLLGGASPYMRPAVATLAGSRFAGRRRRRAVGVEGAECRSARMASPQPGRGRAGVSQQPRRARAAAVGGERCAAAQNRDPPREQAAAGA